MRPSRATAEAAFALISALGISHCHEITGRDRLNLPVAVSTRPRGTTNRLHWGKGLSIDDARTGALMEAVEFAVAENVSARGAEFRLPMADLIDLLPVGLGVEDFAPRRGVDVSLSRKTSAMWCDNLVGGAKVLVPAELVLLPYPAEEGDTVLYGWSSNGLASGNTLEEATLHALFEVLERDAIAMNFSSGGVLVEPATLPPWVRIAMDAWSRHGAKLAIRSLRSAVGVACFEAVINDPAHAVVRRATGWGCHDDRDIALARAVCEAAQVRLVAIQMGGGPTPTGPAMLGLATGAAIQGLDLQPFNPAARSIGYEEIETRRARSFRVALDALLVRLVDAGIPAVFRRQMDFDDDPDALGGLRVVKLVVPGCEPGAGRAGPKLCRSLGASRTLRSFAR